MRKFGRWALSLITVLALVWLVVGGLVWSRNRAPALDLPPRDPLPADNVYADYLDCVRSVQQANVVAELFNADAPDPAKRQSVLRANEALLKRLASLTGRPSMVTELEPGVDFVGAIAFPDVTRLLALAAQEQAAHNPSRALDPLIDGLFFSEGVLRGGAILHLVTGFLSYAPIFQTFPAILPRLPAGACQTGAERLRPLIAEQSPLAPILQNERRIRLRQIISTFEPGATRIFRLSVPTDGYQWSYLMRPKAPAVNAVNAYFEHWVAEAEKPPAQISPPPAVTELEGILSLGAISPEEIGKDVLRYHYKNARLRLIYTALRLEHHRKTRGQYPPSLDALGRDPLFTDPFSGQPFIYRRSGTDFALYSVGPNGKDDGGESHPEGGMSPGHPGDLLLEPNFPPAPGR